MKPVYIIIFLLSMVFIPAGLFAQGESTTGMRALPGKVVNGDTVLMSHLPEVNIFPAYKYKNRWDYWRYRRLVRNVKIAYPYAKIAAARIKEIDRNLVAIKGKKARKDYIKASEKEMMEDFEDDVRNLTMTQGRILLKLIDRETGNTTYFILQDLKGNFSAVFWQTIARVFGSNLKSEYDPQGDDRLIEQIVRMIDAGQL